MGSRLRLDWVLLFGKVRSLIDFVDGVYRADRGSARATIAAGWLVCRHAPGEQALTTVESFWSDPLLRRVPRGSNGTPPVLVADRLSVS
jgi:hypothetical protein